MSKLVSSGIFTLFFFIFFLNCKPKEKRARPSPLRSDSTAINDSNVKIQFGSPAVKGRMIWGGLEPYDTLWRTGANEATRLSTTKRVKINGVSLDSGSYALFTIPRESTWSFILNENYQQWGTYDYDRTLDVLRINLVPEQMEEFSERMKFYFENDSLKFHWANLGFSLGIE